jgi:hypothetical protein
MVHVERHFSLSFMNPPRSYMFTCLILLTLLTACDSTKTAKKAVYYDPVGEYPGGEETYRPFDGYIDAAYRSFSGLQPHPKSPTKTIGKEQWTYQRLDTHREVAFVTFQTEGSFYEWQFGLENDTLVYAEEKETLLPVENGDSWYYNYVIFKDTVVAFSAERTGDVEVKSEEEKSPELFKMWQSHQANFKNLKFSLGFDGVKDVAAMDVYQAFRVNNYNYLEKYMDAATPLRITTSYSDQAMEDKVILCVTEEEKRKFFNQNDKTRGKSILASTHGNQAVFEPKSSKTKVYLKELVFSEEMVLLEIKLRENLGE